MEKPDGLILDFDGVFYRYTPQMGPACREVAHRVAISLGVPPKAAQKAFTIAGEATNVFAEFSRDHGVSRSALYHAFHEGIDLHKVISTSQEASSVFNELKASKIPMVILTHATLPWVKRVLSHIGQPNFLPDSHIIAAERCNYAKKSETYETVMMAAEVLNISPDRLAMIEDSHANLVFARAIGVKTGYVHFGKPLEEQPVHVCHQAPSVAALVRQLGL
jgi:FMN phosphatase YigB (HAD superfamily)